MRTDIREVDAKPVNGLQDGEQLEEERGDRTIRAPSAEPSANRLVVARVGNQPSPPQGTLRGGQSDYGQEFRNGDDEAGLESEVQVALDFYCALPWDVRIPLLVFRELVQDQLEHGVVWDNVEAWYMADKQTRKETS